MASPHYSTPYSQLSYPSYTPLSVMPVKAGGSPAWSEADVQFLRAAVKRDVAHQHAAAAPQPVHRKAAHHTTTSAWPTPDTGAALRTSTGMAAFSSQSTRTNAPVFAPLPTASAMPPPTLISAMHYSDIDRVSASSVAARPMRPSPSSAAVAFAPGAAVVGGTEVDVQSDIVCAAEAAPYLCAFQEECQSLLAMLGAPPTASRSEAAAVPAALPPPPRHRPTPLPYHTATGGSYFSPTVPMSAMHTATGPSSLAAPLRPVPSPPAATMTAAAAAAAPGVSPSPSPVSSTHCSSASAIAPTPPPPPPSQPVETAAAATAVIASPPTSTTYAQLLQEMDELESFLQQEDSVEGSSQPQQMRQLSQSEPSGNRHASKSAASAGMPVDSQKATPEKQTRPCRSSASHISPATTEVVTHSQGLFWTSQLLRWVVFLVERKQSLLRRIQSFENARAPQRRGAAIDVATDASADKSAAVRVSDGVLRLLRSLDPSTSDVGEWTSGQQRQVCTRMANLLADLTSSEEAVVADLLNDAAAGATMEREGVAPPSSSSPPPPPVTLAAAGAPVVGLPSEYRRDMLETIALLEKISDENRALKLQVAQTQELLKSLRDEATGERDAKREVAQHFERVAARNSELAAQLRDVEAKLREAETREQPTAQDDVLRGQFERQTLHLREVRRELDGSKDECDGLRRTVLQLRDALVRHRAVIDLLTRRRRARQRGAPSSASRPSGSRQESPRQESPPMQLIEDILSGVRDAPSSHSSTLLSHTEDDEEEKAYDVSNYGSSDAYGV